MTKRKPTVIASPHSVARLRRYNEVARRKFADKSIEKMHLSMRNLKKLEGKLFFLEEIFNESKYHNWAFTVEQGCIRVFGVEAYNGKGIPTSITGWSPKGQNQHWVYAGINNEAHYAYKVVVVNEDHEILTDEML